MPKKAITRKKICHFSLLALITIISFSLIQTSQYFSLAEAASSDNQWAINMQAQRNGQASTTNTTFTPFDMVQLSATVTYGGTTVPNTWVTFKVQSPSASNRVNITRIVETDADGEAVFSFRLPGYTNSSSLPMGTWLATAAVETSEGIIQQSLNVTTRWNLEITSISLQDLQGHNQTTFHPGDVVKVGLTINNKTQTQAVNVTLNMVNATGVKLNQTSLQNAPIQQNSTQLQANMQIPNSTTAGLATIIASITSGNIGNISIPLAENKTASFTIAINGTEPIATPTPTSTPTVTSSPTPTPEPFEVSISLFSWLLIATGFFTFTTLTIFLRRKTILNTNARFPKLPPKTLSQEQETQTILTHLNRISNAAKRIQELQTELKSEQELHQKNLKELNKSIDNQEQEIKEYFSAVRDEIKKAENGQAESSEDKGGKQQKDN